MKIYCAPCGKKKLENPELIEAIKRYQSERIQSIFENSKKDGVEFRILSGELGLLKSDDKIPFYDHPLLPEEIPQLTEKINQQIRSQNIDYIVFFSKPFETHERRKPYVDLIKKAASETGVSLEIRIIQ